VPSAWLDVVTRRCARRSEGAACGAGLDPEHYVAMRSGRPVFLPEPDSKLLHLGHALYHRVMSVFARYRFPGGLRRRRGGRRAPRWTCRRGPTPGAAHRRRAGGNELREPCHHWVRTLAFPVTQGALGGRFHTPPAAWDASDRRPTLRRHARCGTTSRLT
jgi:hypothetical protein